MLLVAILFGLVVGVATFFVASMLIRWYEVGREIVE